MAEAEVERLRANLATAQADLKFMMDQQLAARAELKEVQTLSRTISQRLRVTEATAAAVLSQAHSEADRERKAHGLVKVSFCECCARLEAPESCAHILKSFCGYSR